MGISRVLYKSRATIDFDEAALRTLLLRSRIRNSEASLSGMLLYDGSHFLQVLEGPHDAMTSFLARIREDVRHTDVTVISTHADLFTRVFPKWSMNYGSARNTAHVRAFFHLRFDFKIADLKNVEACDLVRKISIQMREQQEQAA